MRILLTNDDGIFAPGLGAIYKELVELGEVTVVAPADSQSGASHSITFSGPLVVNEVDIHGKFRGFSVVGSPADCVKLAYMELHEGPIDLVVAGLNNGANSGINIYYSGTVAAAVEGAFLKVPAVAMSVSAEQQMDFEKAARYCGKILKKLLPIEKGEVINVNIPPLSRGQPKGVRVVPQSHEGFEEYYTRAESYNGQMVFRLGGVTHRSTEKPTDNSSLEEGFITVTALAVGMTNQAKTKELSKIEWEGVV